MENFEKILSLQTFCDSQVLCSKCPLKNIDGDAGCCGRIEDWDDEKVERAYKMAFEEKKVLKEFLTDRCVVELRNGERYLVVGDFLMGENDYFMKGDFTDDLAYRSLRKFDIVRIYEEILDIGALHYKELGIIWERKPKEMTIEEIEEALGYEIKVVRKDE